MKKILIIAITLFTFGFTFAQKAVGSHENLEKFYKTTTCIVYDDDIFSPYNQAIEKNVKQFWTITPYKFISLKDFDKMKNDERYSFLLRTIVYSTDKNQLQYNTISLILGQPATTFDKLPEIGSIPLTFIDQEDFQYVYKLGAFLIFLQNHINITYNNKSLNELNILPYYKKNKSSVVTKTLYLTADDLANDDNTTEKIAKIYSGKVQIVEPEQIEQLIANKDTTAIFLHIVAPVDTDIANAKVFKIIVGAADGNLYYFDESNLIKNTAAKFTKDDFSKLK